MIDEETERRIAELESQERGKSKSPKEQKTNGVDGMNENHHEQSEDETESSVQVNGDGTMSNGHHKENGHTNGHAE